MTIYSRMFSSLPRRNLEPISSHSPFFPNIPNPMQPKVYFYLSAWAAYSIQKKSHNIKYVVLYAWLLSLSMSLRFIHIAVYISTSFLLIVEWTFHCMDNIPHFTHPFTQWRTFVSTFLTAMNYTSINICTQGFYIKLGLPFPWVYI